MSAREMYGLAPSTPLLTGEGEEPEVLPVVSSAVVTSGLSPILSSFLPNMETMAEMMRRLLGVEQDH